MRDLPIIGYEGRLEALRLGYLGRLQREAAELKEILEWHHNTSLRREDLSRLHRLAHGLSGTGAIFGFPGISEDASPLDQMLEQLLLRHARVEDIPLEDMRALGAMLSTLQDSCSREASAYVAEAADKEAQTQAAQGPGPNRAFILLVDDDRALADFLSEALRSRGIHVVTAADGAEALKIIERQAPDLVVMDVMMPGLSGHDVLKRLQYDPHFSLIPVVMLSAAQGNAGGNAETAKRLGAIDYIAKPFQPEDLIAHLEKLLDAARFHVVITDNDDMLLDILREKFRQRGFRVSTQNDGKEAWDFIFKALPDLVILDRMMPGMDGMAVLKNIRTEPETKNTPVIVLSARKEERDIQIGMQFGAQAYVTKPCDPEVLLDRALELLHSAGPGKKHSKN